MDLQARIGLNADTLSDLKLFSYANLKLAYLGLPTVNDDRDDGLLQMAASWLPRQQEAERLLADHLAPVDGRIQDYIDSLVQPGDESPRLPGKTFVLDKYGLARILSLPSRSDVFVSEIVSSYRVKQGVVHNPASDRRTTEGIFHVAEGGLPIPDDKKAVPLSTFMKMTKRALAPPASLLSLPFTSDQAHAAECFVTLLLRPTVRPVIPGLSEAQSMEVRFYAPGSVVGNLDFVESIFGNAGDPLLSENDAALDVEHWTGHTGCVILAPHLVRVTKQEVGLPHWDQASERQRRDGMCWKLPDERYNDGKAFKLTCRDERGVIVTLIADNYFGYCKKEVKTQISYAANLSGHSEEEHAGGALVFPSYDLGEEYSGDLHAQRNDHSLVENARMFGDFFDFKEEGYAVDRLFTEIKYVPKDAFFDLLSQKISWTHNDQKQEIHMLPSEIYIRPSGYKVRMERIPGVKSWRLVGTAAEGTLCHKPCTVSGGGKSEISKSLADAILQGPVFVASFKDDFDMVEELVARDYGDRFIDETWRHKDSRKLLSLERSLGSVIKLLTPATREYSDQYNDWLNSIPQHIKELVFVVKRQYQVSWGDEWRSHFSVDVINGTPGNELRCDGRRLVASYLRVGYEPDGSWRTFGLRKDFHASDKIAMEDDITASAVVPSNSIRNLNPECTAEYVKFIQNCEYRLFQRPDDAIHRGYDKQTESDFSKPGNFFSNYEPLAAGVATEFVKDSIGFDEFTAPLQNLIQNVAGDGSGYFVSSAHPRIVDGKPTKNPRYLQTRPDLLQPVQLRAAEMGARLGRRIPAHDPVPTPVDAVLQGRRNNPAEPGVRPLAVFNPVHYLETPELFMELISSMTGKSPSTTGAGSEGALTKGPFNALPPVYDLNAAFVSHALTGSSVFITAAGHVGPNVRVDHDVSLLVPEIWARMTAKERDPAFLIANAYLEKCEDLQFEGRVVQTSRLGYRITRRFVRAFLGRIFSHPQFVFREEMLRPEKQDLAVCVDAMDNIVSTHTRVAQHYFNDGSIEFACPPLRALLHLMVDDNFEGKSLTDPDIRELFTREALLGSKWYQDYCDLRSKRDIKHWQRHINNLQLFMSRTSHADEANRLDLESKFEYAKLRAATVRES